MADFKTQQDFRKGSLLRKINEDPTYLSFFLVFDTESRIDSPLFSGGAKDYLTKVLNQDHAKKYAVALDNFQKVLIKINKELPWFWQTISGLDAANTYKNLADPWWGADKPKLEIECLEENVELTAIGLMDLYKRACYDFVRWVEIIPPNLRKFQMQVWVSEVRKFQQDTSAKDLNFYGKDTTNRKPGTTEKINQEFSLSAKPFIQLQFSHCEFDIDSIAPMFADIGKNPELRKPKIAIKWGSVEQINQKLGANLVTEEDDTPLTAVDRPTSNPFDPSGDRRTIDESGFSLPADPTFGSVLKENTLGKVYDFVEDTVDGVTSRVSNITDSLSLKPGSEIGNIHGKATGFAAGLIDKATEKVLSKLLLGNVHGLQGGSLLDAVQSGSINAIANQLGSLFGGFGANGGSGSINENIHPTGVDSSPDGFLNQRIHPKGVDSSPDGNLNNNVHG
tara:strand:+ start:1229 stop:2578 length:1350 start_codon:yes stop_codon:yes gene_type:complete